VQCNSDKVVISGGFAYGDNLGVLLIALGTVTTLFSFSTFIAHLILFLAVNTIMIPFEEENRLQKNFGIEYERY
jgi:protein-S-isoprenylcysteine O-methyltransferase Ste14